MVGAEILFQNFYVSVVGLFTEIKTGYRGFETNKIQYFVCLVLCSKIIRMLYMRQDLQLEMAFARLST